jgi:hypothetical protein
MLWEVRIFEGIFWYTSTLSLSSHSSTWMSTGVTPASFWLSWKIMKCLFVFLFCQIMTELHKPISWGCNQSANSSENIVCESVSDVEFTMKTVLYNLWWLIHCVLHFFWISKDENKLISADTYFFSLKKADWACSFGLMVILRGEKKKKQTGRYSPAHFVSAVPRGRALDLPTLNHAHGIKHI